MGLPAPKIINEQEAIRWLEEGRTYQWMSDQYLLKYNVEIGKTAWSAFRRRRGIPRRNVRDSSLIPWMVEERHRYLHPIICLRSEARRRAGHDLPSGKAEQLDRWLEMLRAKNLVVHYDPATDEGWSYLPRREGVDAGLIREPERKTGRRAAY